jgi:hypothetical protein
MAIRNPKRMNSICLRVVCRCVAALALMLAAAPALHAQHIHVNAGASNTTQNARLYFINATTYDTNSRYDVYLSFTNGGAFSNLYQGAGVSFTALASTLDNGGPAFGHAADGAVIQLEFVSVSGPPGGVFGVWTQEVGNASINLPAFSMAVGITNGTNRLRLSENDGSAGADPYGHIHGRTYTATKAGLYTLGCRLLDTSSNGAGGGPIHTPSPLYYFYFQAGPTISSWRKFSNSVAVTFGTTAGKTYYVESSTNLSTTNWTAWAGPFTGDNKLRSTTNSATAPNQFFRLRSN